jgi:hypothetical protein
VCKCDAREEVSGLGVDVEHRVVPGLGGFQHRLPQHFADGIDRPGASYYCDFLINACRRAGFDPQYRVSRVQGCLPQAAALPEDAAAFVTAPSGPAVDGAVTVIDLDEPLLVPMQGLWQPHTNSAVRDLILR